MLKRCVLSLSLVFGTHTGLSAQDWPTKPVRIIIPWGAGSSIDIVTRTVSDQIATKTGQTIVVENRPGAAGTIGTAAVARSDPDGYTLLSNSNAHFLTEFTQANLPYSPTKDLIGVAGLVIMPNVLVVNPSRFKSMKEFIAAARSKPDALTYGSIGVGATSHLNVKRLEMSAGFKAVHVAFKAQPEVLTEVLTGRLDFAFAPAGSALQLIRDGKLRVLAVSTPKRSLALPEVPTSIEAGYPNSDYRMWQGIFAPRNTPAALVRKIADQVNQVLKMKSVQDSFSKLGIEPMITETQEDFAVIIRDEVALSKELADAAGLRKSAK